MHTTTLVLSSYQSDGVVRVDGPSEEEEEEEEEVICLLNCYKISMLPGIALSPLWL